MSEFALNVFATQTIAFQDDALGDLDQHLPADAPPFHIYIVAHRPRVSDYNSVCVEINSENLLARLYSEHVERRWTHFALFALHDPAVRAAFFETLVES